MTYLWCGTHFNPRTPLQSAMVYKVLDCDFAGFQSTHSITECDFDDHLYSREVVEISIHALHYRVRSDRGTNCCTSRTTISIHALHYRVRFIAFCHCLALFVISIHALHYRVRSAIPKIPTANPNISIHALHYRVRYNAIGDDVNGFYISIHALHYRVR